MAPRGRGRGGGRGEEKTYNIEKNRQNAQPQLDGIVRQAGPVSLQAGVNDELQYR